MNAQSLHFFERTCLLLCFQDGTGNAYSIQKDLVVSLLAYVNELALQIYWQHLINAEIQLFLLISFNYKVKDSLNHFPYL